MSAGAMLKYIEEKDKSDQQLLSKIKAQDNGKGHLSKGGNGKAGKGKGYTPPTTQVKSQSAPSHPPYTDKVMWICKSCLWGNWNLEDKCCHNRKCRAPNYMLAAGGADPKNPEPEEDPAAEDQRKKNARLKTLMGPVTNLLIYTGASMFVIYMGIFFWV